jgi:hypothetical protein
LIFAPSAISAASLVTSPFLTGSAREFGLPYVYNVEREEVGEREWGREGWQRERDRESERKRGMCRANKHTAN